MSYKKIITEEFKKTNLKDNSIKLYTIRLNNLYNDVGGVNNTNDHLNDTKKIMNYINKSNSLETKVAYLNAITKILEDGNIKDIYTAERKLINNQKFKNYKTNIKPEGFTDYNKLLEASPAPDFTQGVKTVLYDFLLYISVRYPLRLNLWDMKIITKKKDINENENYLYMSSKKMTIIMNNFKNINSMGKQEIEIENIDKPVIKEYIKFLKKHLKAQKLNMEYLLYNFYNNEIIPLSSKDIYGRILSRLLKKKLDKDLTMNDIRHSKESGLIQSEEYKTLTNKEKDDRHKKLLHNTNTANVYYNKV